MIRTSELQLYAFCYVIGFDDIFPNNLLILSFLTCLFSKHFLYFSIWLSLTLRLNVYILFTLSTSKTNISSCTTM